MFDDARLREDVLAEISWEPSVGGDCITVTAGLGIVTLRGHVDSFAQKSAAAAAARRVNMVRAVVEHIEVRLPAQMSQPDDAIEAAARARLSSNVFVPADCVKIAVVDSRVTLTGELDWWFQREAVEQDIRLLAGIIDVSNRTTIRSRSDHPEKGHPDMGGEIVDALYRSWFLNPGDVLVQAKAGKIRLSGEVHSLHDSQTASLVAWSAPGATAVENDIGVL